MHRLTHLLRCLAVWGLATAVALGLGRVVLLDLHRSALPADAAGALTSLCEVVLLACLVWAWVATTAVVLELAPGRPRAVAQLPGVPGAWRRWVLLACGVALAAGLTAPAQATPGAVHLDPDGRRTDRALSLAGLPMPDRPADAHRRVPAAAPVVTVPTSAPATRAVPAPTPGTAVVRPGDSLWSIAAADLDAAGADADPSAVAERWRSIYAVNRDVLGPDPDVIVAGQHLDLPPL